jgi:hypothetical protein
LLAARQRPGGLPSPLLQARKEPEHPLDVLLDAGLVFADVSAHREIFFDRERAEDAATLGHHGEPLADELEGGPTGHFLAGVTDGSRLDRLQTGDPLQRRRLARAVRTDEADELALVDVEIDSFDGLDSAVGDLDSLELEQCVRMRTGARCHVRLCPLQVQRDLAAKVRGDHLRVLLHFGCRPPRRSFFP